ncbi:hypothetical protein ACJRO7_033836 [Eucalyptus globulus]|uniref:tRNA (guanine(46)-N(7))-methyltransferase n=1 Tax=Eucalyptus globulus TaxID=34317 RepID=A0ABD3J4Q5_EUCGL
MIERETTSTFNKLTGSPRKRFYGARAHSNPLKRFALSCSTLPYPKRIQFADIGCGFGGQLFALSTLFPDRLMIEGWKLGTRTINAVQYQNISVVRTNSMKYIPNYFEGQLTKIKNHCGRVISPHLLDEHAYTLAVGGIIYTITDVEELGEWMKGYLENQSMFEALMKEES